MHDDSVNGTVFVVDTMARLPDIESARMSEHDAGAGAAPDRGNKITALFGLKGDAWMRHANPASVWTRFAVLPLLALAIWARDWIGWWCLVPVVLLMVWLVINPRFFDPPASTKHWASKSVFGERIWTESDHATLPVEFRSRVPAVAQAYQVIGLAAMVYGLIVLNVIAAVGGLIITEGGKLWYLDRMVLLYEVAKISDRTWVSWEY